ncbi:hypothetical protein BGZ58_004988 [Dissophora ornata]|nr:hypothetical protein BGZ58_004988 [Dissophora ornata]
MEREGRLPQTAGGTGGHDDGIPIQQQHYTQHKSKVTDHRKDEQHASSGRRSKSVPDLMSQAKARGVGLSGGGAAWPLTRPTPCQDLKIWTPRFGDNLKPEVLHRSVYTTEQTVERNDPGGIQGDMAYPSI